MHANSIGASGPKESHRKAGYMGAILFSYTVILSCNTRWTIYVRLKKS